jgi:hypothetical protein
VPLPITLVVEGTTDAAVARRLLAEAGLNAAHEYVMDGKAALDRSLAAFNSAARFSHWLVLRDLDSDAGCAPALRRQLLPQPASPMRLHVAVRAIEAWLLADAGAASGALGIALARIPADPEALPHPKRTLINLARQSRKRAVREALIPGPATTAAVGPGYAGFIVDFATNLWRPAVAARRSDSLARLREALRQAAGSTRPVR